MSDGTHISWTDATWNPIRASHLFPPTMVAEAQSFEGRDGWVCVRVSPGCTNCYAAEINKRLGTGLDYTVPALAKVKPFLDERTLAQPLKWRKPRRVFVCSMTDLFGEWVPDEWIDRVFAVMALTPQHTYQLLTKRPERMRAYLADRTLTLARPLEALAAGTVERISAEMYGLNPGAKDTAWPLPNVWLGVSVEDQRRADERIPELLATPAAVRFLSVEPMLERVDLDRWLHDSDCWMRHLRYGGDLMDFCSCGEPREEHISWVICGAESGPKRRPFEVRWALDLWRQCQEAGVAFFAKQGSGLRSEAPFGHPDLDGVREFPPHPRRGTVGAL